MVKRVSWKRYGYLLFAFMVMMMCWESNRSNVMLVTAAAAETGGEANGQSIPQESIRLRILANSDAPADQWIKREVRDAIVAEMEGWVEQPKGIEEAREAVRAHLPELSEVVGSTLRKNGFDYAYNVELGTVPFPTKMYGNEVYPAGEYEALRVSIGEAEGQNWWCVLFPPLCFIDSEMVVKPENTAQAAGAEEAPENNADEASAESRKGAKPAEAEKKAEGERTAATAAKPEVRFFLWDLLQKIGTWFA
ncbi:stage II sporulation protein R [Paenibacillus mucilaginosus]|uniref:Stage II sporulation protein R n=2 Tax=Paenibacillus mucilaginosus TaxID=61624 RepID=H6NST5_9BACL|nr:stage II sporulation protein R [Paenibacillus mucilaginosus]AEI38688.1 stage II sporulation protein R [Paenibacillus mucilaginosus KNP414]AFC27025.1 stage II sporulation protein R [Paenibacillus mucilaginosus 3016]MCG7215826.1 stage II sporulation protein R [Paenibacillus mucilaginosus]WDM27775.1 stage II sporulation protein R [Paenibacillus mucilaginosus]WFA15960.1 stage II sporulation protein R [Paenibacillus mucilaginosus]